MKQGTTLQPFLTDEKVTSDGMSALPWRRPDFKDLQSALIAQLTPNHAFERTAASAPRLLAVPSSLRSSAAAQRER